MIEAKQVWDLVKTGLNYDTDDEIELIQNTGVLSYDEIARLSDWVDLRSRTQLTFTAEANGVALPTNLVDITGVKDNATGTDYVQIPAHEWERQPYRKAWFYNPVADLSDPVPGRMLSLTDGAGALATGVTADIYYWVHPPELLEEDQVILVPPRLLVLKIIVDLLGMIDKEEANADRYRAEYNQFLALALAQNADAPEAVVLRSRHGRPQRHGARE